MNRGREGGRPRRRVAGLIVSNVVPSWNVIETFQRAAAACSVPFASATWVGRPLLAATAGGPAAAGVAPVASGVYVIEARCGLPSES